MSEPGDGWQIGEELEVDDELLEGVREAEREEAGQSAEDRDIFKDVFGDEFDQGTRVIDADEDRQIQQELFGTDDEAEEGHRPKTKPIPPLPTKKDIEEHEEDAAAGHKADLVPVRVLNMASALMECDPTVLHDQFTHADDRTVNFRVLEHEAVNGPIWLLMLEVDLALIWAPTLPRPPCI